MAYQVYPFEPELFKNPLVKTAPKKDAVKPSPKPKAEKPKAEKTDKPKAEKPNGNYLKCSHCAFTSPEEGKVMCTAFDKMKSMDECNERCCEFQGWSDN